MKTIKMMAGYSVNTNTYPSEYQNFILVDNYDAINKVSLTAFSEASIVYCKDQYSIGVWKIKNLK